MDENKGLLPIGTVLLLKEAQKALMITGFFTASQENPDKIYDYCGCIFPEGVLAKDLTVMFDHAQIDKILHKGLENEEEKEFKKNLYEYISSPEVDAKVKEKLASLGKDSSTPVETETTSKPIEEVISTPAPSSDDALPLFEVSTTDSIDSL